MLVLPLFFVNYLYSLIGTDPDWNFNMFVAQGDSLRAFTSLYGNLPSGVACIITGDQLRFGATKKYDEDIGSRFIYTVFILNFLGHGMRKNDNKIIGR